MADKRTVPIVGDQTPATLLLIRSAVGTRSTTKRKKRRATKRKTRAARSAPRRRTRVAKSRTRKATRKKKPAWMVKGSPAAKARMRKLRNMRRR